MAHKPTNFKGRNPTGDKAFNAITKIVHGGPTAPTVSEKLPTEGVPPTAEPASPGIGPKGKPSPKGKAKSKYSTATNSFMRC